MLSTSVENVRQINFFMQNKANFPHFSPKNEDFAKKQTQYKPNSNPNKANFGPKSPVAKPNKPNFLPSMWAHLTFCRGQTQNLSSYVVVGGPILRLKEIESYKIISS